MGVGARMEELSQISAKAGESGEGMTPEQVARFLFRVGQYANVEIWGGDVPSDYPWSEEWCNLPEHAHRLFLEAAIALMGGDLDWRKEGE